MDADLRAAPPAVTETCTDCGGGESYFRHGPGDPLSGYHPFQPPAVTETTDLRAALDEHSPLPRFGTYHIDCRCGWDAPRAGVIVWWVTHASAAIEAALADTSDTEAET